MNNTIRYSFSAATNIGQRQENQDYFSANGIMPPQGNVHCYTKIFADEKYPAFFAVSDGVGSLADSAKTATITLAILNEKLKNIDINSDLTEWTLTSIDSTHQKLREYMKSLSLNGANTLSCLLITNNQLLYANVGDSPGFVLKKGGTLEEISVRHNLETYKRFTGQLVEEGDSSYLLYCFDGSNCKLSDIANIWTDIPSPGDKFLLCSDGITNALNEKQIASLLNSNAHASEFVKSAAKVPNADNCTAIVIYID